MKKLFEKVRTARQTLQGIDTSKVAYVSEAHAAYTTEAAQMDDELNFTGHPEEVKNDFLAGAVLEDRMTEEEFIIIWNAISIIDLAYSDC